ncbi:MAG: ribonuclease [Clostridiales bacterium]|nr:ribonuclease [Clostridiales bacterium]
MQEQSESGLMLLDSEAQTEDPAATVTGITESDPTEKPNAAIDEKGTYTTKEDVSLYLYTYGYLPENFITKSEARALGWSGGGLDVYDYGKCIGGDRFGNNEGLLPESRGRQYYECDIDTLHRDDRGAKRIVFSNDGLIYYTENHYDSFELLYGEP